MVTIWSSGDRSGCLYVRGWHHRLAERTKKNLYANSAIVGDHLGEMIPLRLGNIGR
jgi:hypothetical protein